MSAGWARDGAGGAVLEVLAQPRASKSRVVGEHDGRLKIQLAAPPVDGEANAALLAFLADALGVRRADVALLAGETGRRKRVRIAGLGAGAAADRLLALAPGAPAAPAPAPRGARRARS
jgi:uncharacterized protein (TIGR00251 family)